MVVNKYGLVAIAWVCKATTGSPFASWIFEFGDQDFLVQTHHPDYVLINNVKVFVPNLCLLPQSGNVQSLVINADSDSPKSGDDSVIRNLKQCLQNTDLDVVTLLQ